MNKRYMDFVPKNSSVSVKKPVRRAPVQAVEEPESVVSVEEILVAEDVPHRAQREVEYGVIEEYRPKFVRTEVKKRPLGQPDEKFAKSAAASNEVKALKAQKLVGKKIADTPEPVQEKKPDASSMPVPKARFVNTEKIEKRPLSKNVYKKKVETPKEEPTGPVTIITKPENGSHIGVIVTIILTIILGAAAGTVAFLLLPK